MKKSKAIILGTTLLLSLTLTACNGTEQKAQVSTGQDKVQDTLLDQENKGDLIKEIPENESVVNEKKDERFAEGAGKGIENSDIRFADESLNIKFSDLSMTMEEGSLSPTGLTLIFENSGVNEYQYGSYYYIEKREVDDQWTPLIVEEDIMWSQELYSVLLDQPSVSKINWETLYGILPSGEYRIIKQITEVRGADDTEIFMKGLTFTIE